MTRVRRVLGALVLILVIGGFVQSTMVGMIFNVRRQFENPRPNWALTGSRVFSPCMESSGGTVFLIQSGVLGSTGHFGSKSFEYGPFNRLFFRPAKPPLLQWPLVTWNWYNGWSVRLPYWFLFLVVLSCWAASRSWTWFRSSRDKHRVLCTTCGYDLRGTPATSVCSECGNPRSQRSSEHE